MIIADDSASIVTLISSIVPARQAARMPPIAAMRDVAHRATDQRPPALGDRRRDHGARRAAPARRPVRRQRHRLGRDRCAPHPARRLRAQPAVRPWPSRAIGAPLAKIKGITGSLARENAARNPRRTATTGAAVMIAVSLVGFITIFAASANASISAAIDQPDQDRLHHHQRRRLRRHRTQPRSSTPEHRRSSRRSQPATPVRVGDRRHQRQRRSS